ncbi:MAG TPA: hypothetical protein VF622_17540 [Segetibacter sp.]|jgi:hypothetical protein
MDNRKLEQIISIISKGDIQFAEALFSKPGGRKYLENIVLIVISNLPTEEDEKEDLFKAFVKGLDKIESRIQHQKQGQKILKQIYK